MRHSDRNTVLLVITGLLILLLLLLPDREPGPAETLDPIACRLIFTAAEGVVCEDDRLDLLIQDSLEQPLLRDTLVLHGGSYVIEHSLPPGHYRFQAKCTRNLAASGEFHLEPSPDAARRFSFAIN